MNNCRNNSGFIVETKSGKIGYTKTSDNEIGGKVIVYFEDSQAKLLCSLEKLKIIGYKD